MKFNIEKMENGNYWVQIIKDDKIILERPLGELSSIISLLLTTFDPV